MIDHINLTHCPDNGSASVFFVEDRPHHDAALQVRDGRIQRAGLLLGEGASPLDHPLPLVHEVVVAPQGSEGRELPSAVGMRTAQARGDGSVEALGCISVS